MALYAFAILGLYIAIWRNNEQRLDRVVRTLSSAKRCVTAYPELVLLPLLYWGALNIWFKRVGVYADHYNTHLPTPRELIDGWETFFHSGYIDLLKNTAIAALNCRPLFVLAAVLVIIGFLLVLPEHV